MIFVDTNVLVYAVGRPHPLRAEARAFFAESLETARPLATSAEVLQELLHVYLPVGRLDTLDAALALAGSLIGTTWAIEHEDVRQARALADVHRGLGARDLLHLACCRRRDVQGLKTFDRALAAAFAA
jgi:hypothetical protein